MFRTRSIGLVLVSLMALVALGGVSGAVASPPEPASGDFTYTSSTFNSVREAGGNLIIDLSAEVAYTGTLSGTSIVNGTLIFHANGSANFHDVEVFTGTVNGVSGTLTFNLSGTSHNGVFDGNAVITSGTGGLSNLHGVLNEVGAVQMPTGPFGIYTGQLQIAP